MSGSMRVSLRPMLGWLPVVGAAQLALVRTPKFKYELSLGPMLAALLPLVRSWMDG